MPSSIAMLLTNPFRPDPRVFKEARSLANQGYAVTILCWDRTGEFPPEERIDGVNIRRLTVHSSYSAGSRQIFYLPRFWQAAMKELRLLKPDIIHCHDLDTVPAGYWYARQHQIPWVFDAHECYPEQIGPQVNRLIYHFLLQLERFIVPRATCVITVGELLAHRFHSFGGSVAVVGNYQRLNSSNRKNNITRADLGLTTNEFVVMYIGGFTLARVILPLIKATEIFQDVTVLLMGDGPQRTAIEAELPGHPHVRYLGWIEPDQILDYMALADVIYYGLSATNGNNKYSAPNALFNALAVGKPILTSNVGEIAHIVKKEKCGVVVKETTPPDLAQAMKQLYRPELRDPLATNAYKIAQTRYNWKIAEAVLLDLYQQLTASSQERLI